MEDWFMKSLTDIKAQLEELKPILRKRFLVEIIGIFGSYSRKEQKKNSDIDLLVTFVEPNDIDLVDFIEIKQFLERKLKMKVDLVTRSALKPMIRDRILEETIYV
jgi:predicted nucleotidyltransferase